MEITNKHRDVYKIINNAQKKEKNIKFEEGTEDYNLLQDLIKDNFIILKSGDYKINSNNPLIKKEKEKAYKYLLNKEKKRFQIKRCEKPKFGGRGRTWENFTHNINDIPTDFYIDTSWGCYVYFSASDGRWYKISINIENEDQYYNDINYQVEDMIKGKKQEFIIHY